MTGTLPPLRGACLLLISLCWFAVSAENENAPRVLLVSIDGMHNDYVLKADELGLHIPHLLRLKKEGSMARRTDSVTPSMTFPSHTSMLTGVVPDKHGITMNCEEEWRKYHLPEESACAPHHFYSDITRPTIVSRAHEKGLKVGIVDWPVTVGAPADLLYGGNIMDPGDIETAQWYELTLRGKCVKEEFPDVPSLWDVTDGRRSRLGVAMLKALPLDLMMLHLNDLDDVEHESGVFSTNSTRTLEDIDRALGTVLDTLDTLGARAQTTVMIVSDHGHTNVTKTLHPNAYFTSLGLAPFPVRVFKGSSGGVHPLYLEKNATDADRQKVRDAIDLLTTALHPGEVTFLDGPALRALGGFKGAWGALSANPERGVDFANADDGPLVADQPNGASQHGHVPTWPTMGATFMVSGPGVRRDHMFDYSRSVDVGPTVAHVLGLELGSGLDGGVLTEAFEGGAAPHAPPASVEGVTQEDVPVVKKRGPAPLVGGLSPPEAAGGDPLPVSELDLPPDPKVMAPVR